LTLGILADSPLIVKPLATRSRAHEGYSAEAGCTKNSASTVVA